MRQTPTTAAIIVAAGRGVRAGGAVPKQYQKLRGQPVLTRTVRAFLTHPGIDRVIVVIHPEDEGLAKAALAEHLAALTFTHGGDRRGASVRAGLAALPETTDQVLIHDAARPLVSARIIDRVLAALSTSPAAAPALAVTDALWRGTDAKVTATEPRDGLFSAQTPQGFHLKSIRAAHAAHPGEAADDVEVALAAGLDVAITEGEEKNLKLTTAADFARAAALMEELLDICTGTGFDVHRFGPGHSVILCGVEIAYPRALQGHSDADVGLHAITDAIYGALADGDIGKHFPPTDPEWKDAASKIFLTHAVARATARGFRISSIDCTLICEQPKIGPHATAMREALAAITGIAADRISVKATTSERLGFTGREEGIAALATVTLVSS